MRPAKRVRFGAVGLAVVALVSSGVLAGCGDPGADGAAGEPRQSADVVDGTAEPDDNTTDDTTDVADDAATSPPDDAAAADFPSCDEVKAALGAEAAGLVESEDAENGVVSAADGPYLACAWHTTQVAESGLDLEQYGGVGITITRDDTYVEDEMATLGWNLTGPRVDAAGAWALKPGGGYVAADQLDAMGVQVVRDGILVVISASGVALQDVPELAALTNDWAIGAAVEVLALTD